MDHNSWLHIGVKARLEVAGIPGLASAKYTYTITGCSSSNYTKTPRSRSSAANARVAISRYGNRKTSSGAYSRANCHVALHACPSCSIYRWHTATWATGSLVVIASNIAIYRCKLKRCTSSTVTAVNIVLVSAPYGCPCNRVVVT